MSNVSNAKPMPVTKGPASTTTGHGGVAPGEKAGFRARYGLSKYFSKTTDEPPKSLVGTSKNTKMHKHTQSGHGDMMSGPAVPQRKGLQIHDSPSIQTGLTAVDVPSPIIDIKTPPPTRPDQRKEYECTCGAAEKLAAAERKKKERESGGKGGVGGSDLKKNKSITQEVFAADGAMIRTSREQSSEEEMAKMLQTHQRNLENNRTINNHASGSSVNTDFKNYNSSDNNNNNSNDNINSSSSNNSNQISKSGRASVVSPRGESVSLLELSSADRNKLLDSERRRRDEMQA